MKVVWHISRLPLMLALAALAILAIGVHSLTWFAERNPDVVRDWLSRELGEPVWFETIKADWDGVDLSLALTRVRIGEQGTETEDRPGGGAMEFKRLAMGVDLLQGAFGFDWRPAYLRIGGASLRVHRLADRSLRIAGIRQPLAAREEPGPEGGVDQGIWLLSQAQVSIEDSDLELRDDFRWSEQPPLKLSSVSIHLRNQGDAHELTGEASLSPTYGDRLKFRLSLDGNPLTQAWNGESELHAEGLHLAGWLGDQRIAGVRLHNGDLAVQSHARWEHSRLVSSEADIEVIGLALTAAERPGDTVNWPLLRGKLNWRQRQQGWALEIAGLKVRGPSGDWPEQNVLLVADRADSGQREFSLSMDAISIGDLGRVAPLGNTLPAELAEALVGLQPEGWLNRVHLDWTDSVAATANADGTPSIDQPAMDQAEEYAFDAQLRSANIRPWQDIPGIKGMSADLSARPGVLSAVLLSRDISLDFPGLFRDPLNLSKLDGLLAVVHGEQGIRISGAELKLSNPDIALGGDFRLVLPEQGSPELKIDANFVGEPEDQVPHYLPAGVIPDEAMAFLDRAFLAGKARNGVLRFRGPINDFPFDAPEGEEPTGEFLTAFDVIDGALDFSPDYPNIEQATAHVRFHNKSLTVEGQSARIMGAEVSDVIVTIPDLNDTTVRVQGKARAELSQFEDFVRATPLQERIGPSLKDLALRGEAGLELEVYMPFDGKDMEVSGVLDFPGNDLFVKPMNVRFSDFKGGLSFDGEGVKAKGLSAGFRGEKLNIDVATSANGDTDIELRANLPLQAALGPDGEGMLPFVSGKADWLVRIQAPSWRRSSAATRVSVESDLQGIELSLPKPLEKPGHEKQSFVLETEQGPDGLGPIHVQLGEALDGLFVVTDDRPFSGELRYGLGKAPMPEQPGLAIEARTEETALGGWVELANQGGDDGAAQGGSDWLRLVDARVDRLHAYGRLVRDAHVRLEPSDPSESGPGWKLDVDSKRVAGTILVPNQPGENQPVFAAFTHLHLAKREQEASGESPTDPRELPPIRLIVDDFRYGDFNLGRLELEALPTARGLSVQQMDLNSDALTLHSWGTWGFDGQDHQSQFTIELDSDQFAETMQTFGLGRSLEAEGFSALFDTRWPGSPMSFDLSQLDGRLTMKLGKGRVLDVDPGAGRLFGLLSFTTLPRRLRGDFADLNEEGFVFDSIEGDFDLVNGVATTENLKMVGPAAKLDIRGEVDLKNETVDQIVDVIPEVSSTLPLAGVLAGGVGVGAALLVIQQVLNDPLNRLAKFSYHMHGPWAEPVIDKLNAGESSAGRSGVNPSDSADAEKPAKSSLEAFEVQN